MIRSFFHGRRVIPPFLPFITVFAAIIPLAYIPLMAEEEEWLFVYELEGINVHKRIKEGSRFLEFKTNGDLRGEISEYVSVVLDTEIMPDWHPNVSRRETLNVSMIGKPLSTSPVTAFGRWQIEIMSPNEL